MKLTKSKLREIIREELLNEDKAVDGFHKGISLALKNLKNIRLTGPDVKRIQRFLISAYDIVDGK